MKYYINYTMRRASTLEFIATICSTENIILFMRLSVREQVGSQACHLEALQIFCSTKLELYSVPRF